MAKIIMCGEITEEFEGTPIEKFKKAVEISKREDFEISTNNAQAIEILEILCGEKNLSYYIKQGEDVFKKDKSMDLYDYIGDIYDIINSIRFEKQLNEDWGDNSNIYNSIKKEIEEYEYKHKQTQPNEVIDSNFEKYIEILPKPRIVDAYQAEEKVVVNSRIGKTIADEGDWIIRRENGDYDVWSNKSFRDKFKVME